MSELLKLAERCEALSGPNRDLDAEIAPLQGLRVVDEGHPIGRMCYDDLGSAQLMPRYSASIDAAMTLLPGHEGIGWRASNGAGGPTAEVWVFDYNSGKMLCEAGANAGVMTPALALCAAALRARDALTNSEGGGE